MKVRLVISVLLCVTVFAGCDDGSEIYYSMDDNEDEDDNTSTDGDTDSDSDGDSDDYSDGDTDVDTGTFTPPEDVVNICDEDVPLEHYVDGIPAYSQCPASQDGSIWSDDGLSTSTIQEDTDWARTQGSMGYQCTEFARRYLHFIWDVLSVPNGNAGDWCDGTPPAGLIKTSQPVHGDIMVFAPGSCGASQTYGHVAVVDIVDSVNGTAEFVEQNGANRRSCDITTAACFLHATSNSN